MLFTEDGEKMLQRRVSSPAVPLLRGRGPGEHSHQSQVSRAPRRSQRLKRQRQHLGLHGSALDPLHKLGLCKLGVLVELLTEGLRVSDSFGCS